jgi:rfaE bifunctional protein nucleotidyltransferase chain/domain
MTTSSFFPAVACVQFPIVLGEVEHNIEQAERLLDQYHPAPETLVLLPEMWATGFDYERTSELGQRTPEILAAMQRLAAFHRVYLAGTLTALSDDGSLPTNTLFVVGPQGVIGRLFKQHLFAFWQEDRHYRGGMATPLIQTPHGPLAGLVCYDLRFPEAARRQIFAGSRLLVVSAQWPLSRLDHWQTLVRARAIENQVYVAAVNGCGQTGQMEMAGHSMIVAPDGMVLQSAGTEVTVIGCWLDSGLIDEQRRRFYPAGDRAWVTTDRDKIRVLPELQADLALIRRQGSRIAFTSGCFDILHAGHVSYLEEARRTADCLVVGLNTDASVRGLKGPGRPVNSEADRARVLAGLGCVDYVVLFAEATPIRLITALMPDVLVQRADYQNQPENGS